MENLAEKLPRKYYESKENYRKRVMRYYDEDGYRSPSERTEVKAFAIKVLHFLETNEGWFSSRDIRHAVGDDEFETLRRNWDSIVGLLSDSVAVEFRGGCDRFKREDQRRAVILPGNLYYRNAPTAFRNKLDPIGAMIGTKDE